MVYKLFDKIITTAKIYLAYSELGTVCEENNLTAQKSLNGGRIIALPYVLSQDYQFRKTERTELNARVESIKNVSRSIAKDSGLRAIVQGPLTAADGVLTMKISFAEK